MKKAFVLLVSVMLIGCGQKADSDWEKSTVKSLSGTISILPELAGKVSPTDVLFVMAKGESGPPVAVKKLSPSQFPLQYILSEEGDLMLPGMVFPEELNVTARIYKSGTASPKPGDLGGEYAQNPAKVGQTDIDIEINQIF